MRCINRLLVLTMMLAGAIQPATVQAQVQPLGLLAGVYRQSFANAMADGKPYRSENILEIVPRSATSTYFRAHLEFSNGHQCAISGIADVMDDDLVYDGPVNLEGRPCRLRLSVIGGQIRFADPGGACRVDTCGARGAYDGVAFNLKSRQPIRYMSRLLASPEYAEAVQRHTTPTLQHQ
jgi:hypothetical protein